MINGEFLTAMIPARMGSERLKEKNLVLLDGRPLISYAIQAAKDSGVFDRIVVNSDGEIFKEITQEHQVDFYFRNEAYASSQARADDVVYDFIQHNKSDIIAWVNPTSPLQTGKEIYECVRYFFDNNYDTVITTKTEQIHCNFKDRPLNYDPNGRFAKTQDLVGIERFVYSVMMWKCDSFRKEYEAQKRAFFVGKVGFFPISKMSSIIVKTQEDVELCRYIIEGRKKTGRLQYYKAKESV